VSSCSIVRGTLKEAEDGEQVRVIDLEGNVAVGAKGEVSFGLRKTQSEKRELTGPKVVLDQRTILGRWYS